MAAIRFLKKEKMKIAGNPNIEPELLKRLKSYVYDILGCCQDVHTELGPWLNEYIYQEALKIAFEEKQIPFVKEYYFKVSYHGHPLSHKHYMDFLCKENVAVECKAISSISVEQRQQLWNYMRFFLYEIESLWRLGSLELPLNVAAAPQRGANSHLRRRVNDICDKTVWEQRGGAQ